MKVHPGWDRWLAIHFLVQNLSICFLYNPPTWKLCVVSGACVKGLNFWSQRCVQIGSKTLTAPDPAAAARRAVMRGKKIMMSREATRGPGIYQIPSSWAGVLPSKGRPPPLFLLFQRRQVQRIDGGELSKLSSPRSSLDGNDRRGLGSPHAVIERAAATLIVVNKRGKQGRRAGGGFPGRWCPYQWRAASSQPAHTQTRHTFTYLYINDICS